VRSQTSIGSGHRRPHLDPIAHSIGLNAAPTMTTLSLRSAQVGISRLSIGADRIGMTPLVPPEDSFIVALYLSDVEYHELWSRGRPVLKRGYAAHSMRIVNLQDEYSARIACPHESLVTYIPRAALNEFADDAGGRRIGHLSCEVGTIDPAVTNLGLCLTSAFAYPASVNSLFVDHVCLALCAHLAHAYGGFRELSPMGRGVMSLALVERAKAFMAAHCGDETSLSDVAGTCGLSRGYFSKAFKATTGLSPHEWRQQYRLDKVKSMLLESSVGIAEIAMACGFADQSHLTRVFSRTQGASPANWRRNRRS
jgi:AraC family transcriptional regulator